MCSEGRIISYTSLEGNPGPNRTFLFNPDQCLYWREGWGATYSWTELASVVWMMQLRWL